VVDFQANNRPKTSKAALHAARTGEIEEIILTHVVHRLGRMLDDITADATGEEGAEERKEK
jgi:hypothetical protein